MGGKKRAPDLLSEVLAGKETDQEHKERLGKYAGAKNTRIPSLLSF